MFTPEFIRDHVLPEIQASGGATVTASPYGMPPAILRMDEYQPPTWVVSATADPFHVSERFIEPELITAVANVALEMAERNAWSGVGFWLHNGFLYIEPVETYTHHGMAVEAGKRLNQAAIHALHTGADEYIGDHAALHFGQ